MEALQMDDVAMQSVARGSLPPWVLLYLVGYKVRTSRHAVGPLMDLVYAHLDVTPTNVKAALLILTAFNLARFNLLVPMRRVVNSFLTIPFSNLSLQSLQFNLFLQALSCNLTRSVDNANIIVSILKTMESRQLRLRSSTYNALLNDRFVTLQLTKYLQQRMVQEGFVPKASHLEAYLRVFAKHGAIHDAKKYYEAIHALPQTSDDSVEESAGYTRRARTLFLGAHDDRASAFAFLRTLLATEKVERDSPPHRAPQSPAHSRAPTVFDFTTALNVTARDVSVNKRNLIKAFGQAHTRFSAIRPTVATYTILIRGLLLRRNFDKAEQYLRKLLRTGLMIDKEALSVGLQTLTRVGKPHQAFAMLEKYGGRAKPAIAGVYQLYKPINLTSITINDFLVALNRTGRPDIVFKMWDHMDELYGVSPDSRTLSILLQSARLARKLDDSFSGAVAELALKNPFRTSPTKPTSRESIVASIKAIVGEPKQGVKPYVSGIWNDQKPAEGARTAFLQALFGNASSEQQLRDVQPPACPIRASAEGGQLAGPFGLPKLRPSRPFLELPPGLLTPEGHSRYPHIVVTNANVFNYIVLLGLTDRATEIPQTLAWMREIDIQPSGATLSVALTFWSEVSVQAPLIEQWWGEENSEYTRLERWIKDWVGEERVPDQKELEKWHRIVDKMRERRTS
jgi:pentatricopeptide repeat protein